MIKRAIGANFPLHTITTHNSDIFVADYTDQTKHKKGVIISGSRFTDIHYFKLINTPKLRVCSVAFDNKSFVDANNRPLTQCESASFPEVSVNDSWVLFIELKYSSNQFFNIDNLRKARRQAWKTRNHYKAKGICSDTNTTFLALSLPKQKEPFSNYKLSNEFIRKVKQKYNVIIKLCNTVEIIDDKLLL